MKEKIHIAHLINGRGTQNVIDADDILMLEAQEDLDLTQRALAVRLVLKGTDLFDGSPDLVDMIVGRAVRRGWQKLDTYRNCQIHTLSL